MILTDREIRIALEQGQIFIEPSPNLDQALAATSLDLTLGTTATRWKENAVVGVNQEIEPGKAGFNFSALAPYQETISLEGGFVLEPGRFLLAWTEERVRLPITSRVAARVEGKSSIARLGIGVHITAPTIHAGFEGTIQLEMFNHSTMRIRLTPKMRICQLIFEQTLGTPEQGSAEAAKYRHTAFSCARSRRWIATSRPRHRIPSLLKTSTSAA